MRRIRFALLGLLVLSPAALRADDGPWPAEKARAWAAGQPWLVGCNFSPSTAINQLEMWQAETFDLATIDRELGWAHDLGFTSVRVFLHNLLWDQDREGLLKRMDQFLAVAARHKIGVMFVLFDACWDPFPRLGPQRAPKPHLHNSGWVQAPGADVLKDPSKLDALEPYVTGVISRFANDPRVQVWDLFNEPDNPNTSSYGAREPANKVEACRLLLEKTFRWARAAKPSQPLTSGVWIIDWSDPAKLSAMERLQLEQSDVISYHCYTPLEGMERCVKSLRRYNRPLLCTEFMARPQGSTFDPVLGYLRDQHVGAYCWGFVAGKTQTIYPWESWKTPGTAEPPVWFHDIFRPDGKPFDPAEVAYIRKTTGAATPAGR